MQDLVLAWLDALSVQAEDIASRHNVDPRFFALLYLGSIPPYLLSIAWLVRRAKQGLGVFVPAASTIVFFALPALYVLVFGRNLAAWVRPAVLALLIAGGYSARREVGRRLRREHAVAPRTPDELNGDRAPGARDVPASESMSADASRRSGV